MVTAGIVTVETMVRKTMVSETMVTETMVIGGWVPSGFTNAYTEERHAHRPIQSAMPARQDREGVGGDDGHHRPE
jgi:hypothetical protein